MEQSIGISKQYT